MSDPENPTLEKATEGPTPATEVPPRSTGDVENQTSGDGIGVSSVLSRWKREDLMKKAHFGSRVHGLLFSLLAFIIMASNQHGDWKEFDKYEEYRYLLAVAILSSLYSGLQVFKQTHEISTGKESFSPRTSALVDFFGDQVVAYMLISAASAAIPLTNRMREGGDNIFTDSSASAISMALLAFISLAFSSLLSGYKLSKQSYI